MPTTTRIRESFDPGRWIGVRPDPHSWIPFGGGIRHCLGAALAQFEMDVVLREVLARVDLEPDRQAMEAVHLHAVVMVPDGGRPRSSVTSPRPRSPFSRENGTMTRAHRPAFA